MKRRHERGRPWYFPAVLFAAAILIFAQGYYIYHRSVGPTDGLLWTRRGLIVSVDPDGPGARAGLRLGDRIIALDGVSQPHALRRQLIAITDTYRIGDRHRLIVERQGRRMSVELVIDSNYRGWPHFFGQLFGNVVALAFLTIGVGVFFLKPNDRQVVLFCLAFAAVSTFFGNISPVYLRRLPLSLGNLIWGVQLVLSVFALPLLVHFFLTFPQPIGWVKRWPRLITWIYLPSFLLLPLAVLSTLPLFLDMTIDPRLRDWSRSTSLTLSRFFLDATIDPRLRRELLRLSSATPIRLIAFVYFLAGMMAVVMSYRQAHSPDHKRRMRVIMVGTVMGFAAYLIDRRVYSWESAGSGWEVLLGAMVLFVPLSFAYAIIRHRLFDLRLVVRQSLRYALARHVLFAALISPLALLVIDALAASPHVILQYIQQELPRIGLYIVVGAALIVAHRPLMNWLDRRFFREAYDAQKILSELAERIGLIVDVDELTSFVLNQINDSLHIKHGALLLRESDGDRFRSVHLLGDLPDPPPISAHSPLIQQLEQRSGRPLELSAEERTGWLDQLTQEERRFFQAATIDLVIPLRVSQSLIGLMFLGEKLSEEPYSREDKELLMTVAAQTALGIERARLSERMAEEEKLKREIEIAQEVQARLFPQTASRLATLDMAGVCLPARGVAGDYYDFLPLAPGRLGVAVGDISGKGISAALLMANLQASLRSQAALAGLNVARLLRIVNTLLFRSTSQNKFASLFYAVYDESTRAFTYVNAGHNSPFLFRGMAEGEGPAHGGASTPTATRAGPGLARQTNVGHLVERLETGGTIIGAFETVPFEQETTSLHPGDMVVAYTDGITEACSLDGREFGEERLERLLWEARALTARQIINRIMTAIGDFTRGVEQHDDMTLVVMKVLA